jgi:hypothetical protein
VGVCLLHIGSFVGVYNSNRIVSMFAIHSCNKKTLVKLFSTMNFVVIMGVLATFTWSTLSLGTPYSPFFLLFCGHMDLLMFVFQFHLFFIINFAFQKVLEFSKPSIYGVWILEIIICLCMCSVATSDLGLARIFTTYQHFFEHADTNQHLIDLQ